MTHIRLQNVSVLLRSTVYGRPLEVQALDDVTLNVRSGETMGVIGPTGCGKTTLLRTVAGLVKPDSGTVYFDGVDQTAVPPKDRGLGMVFQDHALYPHLSVWDNLAFYFRLRRREDEVSPKVRDAAEILGVDLSLLLGRLPRNLSVGQRQQVAIARCLVRDPNIFLMDEPFAHLDALQRQHARIQLKRLLNHFRVTTLYVTHDQIEAAALCDRVAFMDRGHVRQVDAYLNLLRWPNDRQVAEFIAEPGTQFVEGAYLEGHFACPAFSLPLQPHVRTRVEPGQGLTVRVRPVAVAIPEPAGCRGVLVRGEASWIEPLPMQHLQRVTCQAASASLTVEVPLDHQVRVGEPVDLCVDPQQVEVFDSKSGANLAFRTPE